MTTGRGASNHKPLRIAVVLRGIRPQEPDGGFDVVSLGRKAGHRGEAVVDARNGEALSDQSLNRNIGLGPGPPRAAVDPDDQRGGCLSRGSQIEVEEQWLSVDSGVLDVGQGRLLGESESREAKSQPQPADQQVQTHADNMTDLHGIRLSDQCVSDNSPATGMAPLVSTQLDPAESCHTLGTDTNPTCGCHFSEGMSDISRWCRFAQPPANV